MGIERWFKSSSPKTDIDPASYPEQQIINRAHSEADPTTFSQLPLRHRPVEIGREPGKNQPIAVSGDRTYVELMGNKQPAFQQAVARMLKGIVNVADVVKDEYSEDGAYYSSVVPIERIKEKNPIAEVQADGYVMEQAFGDWDHMEGLTEDEPWMTNARYEDGKVSYFDFDHAREGMWHSVSFSAPRALAKISDPEVLHIAFDKLELLKQRLSGSEGLSFMRAIFGSKQETKKTLNSILRLDKRGLSAPKQVKYLQDLYLARIQQAEDALLARLQELESARKAA